MDPQNVDTTPVRLRDYRVLRRLATGGTSDVLLARKEGPHGFGRDVVLKLLLPHFKNEAAFERMFAREASAYARLSHPAIVKLYDFFAHEQQLIMVLEYVDGIPLNMLRALLAKRGDLLEDEAAFYLVWRVVSALAEAHSARDPDSNEPAPVVHRDVNPSNVLIPWDGHVKLADFGIAKVTGMPSDTVSGLIKGTYGYMAPEQVKAEPATPKTDLYAASLLLWELLAHRKAIQRTSSELEMLRMMAEPQLPLIEELRPELSPAICDMLQWGLQPLTELRIDSAEEMANALKGACELEHGRKLLVDALARIRPSYDERAQSSSSIPPPASMRTREVLDPLRPYNDAVDAATAAEALGTREAGRASKRPTTPPAGDVAGAPAPLIPTFPNTPVPGALWTEGLPVLGENPPTANAAATDQALAPIARNSPVPPNFFSGIASASHGAAMASGAEPLTAPIPLDRMGPPLAPPGVPEQELQSVWPAPEPTVRRPLIFIGIGFVVVLAAAAAVWFFALRGPASVAAEAGPAKSAPAAVSASPTARASGVSKPVSDAGAKAPPIASSRSPIPSATATASSTPISAGNGRVRLPASAAGHRVYVDGRVVGQGGEPLTLACGRHVVKIGSAGPPHDVDVPCGGEVTVSE